MLKVLCTAINYNTPLCRAMCDCYLVLLFSISAEDFLLFEKKTIAMKKYDTMKGRAGGGRAKEVHDSHNRWRCLITGSFMNFFRSRAAARCPTDGSYYHVHSGCCCCMI